jgi:aspartate dehydrogenase
METRKLPRGLAGAPYVVHQRIDLDAIKAETLILEGAAAEAVKAFPANVNVVAALSLAGVGPERTRIKSEADISPLLRRSPPGVGPVTMT